MRTIFLLYLRLLLFLSSSGLVSAAIIFEDGFESGTLGPQWTVSTSNDGRATVTTNFSPATGQWHLVLDDGVDDAINSSAKATIQLDLSKKKNVTLSFQAKSLGNEQDSDWWPFYENYDGITISTDGGKTWAIPSGLWDSLASVGEAWTTFSSSLDNLAEWDGNLRTFADDIRIRFSEYDNASAPLDGIAIDDVLVTGENDFRAVFEIASEVMEGSGPHTGYVLLNFAPTNTLTLALSTDVAGQLILPATMNIPAGKTMGGFIYSVANDNRPNLTRTVSLRVEAPGITSVPRSLTIFDDDLPNISMTFPDRVTEGDSNDSVGMITLSRRAEVPLTLWLSQSPSYEIDLPGSVTIPADELGISFPVRAIDDDRIDGTVSVNVAATARGIPTVTATIETVDNETIGLSLLLPESILEGTTLNGRVRLSGSVSTNIDIAIRSGNESHLSVPSKVTIPAGSLESSFPLLAPNNSAREGKQVVRLDASAPGFPATNTVFTIRDDDVAAYRFQGLAAVVDTSTPLYLSVEAIDVEGNPIVGLSRAVHLSLINADGTTLTVSPNSVSLADAGWSGLVTLPPGARGPVRLRSEDSSGAAGESIPFDLIRYINGLASDLVWDPTRGRIYASISAYSGDTNANKVVSIDPTRALITGGVRLGQNPGKLTLTSGGEFLYVVLNANGTIARINPDTMSVESSFSVGTDPQYGTLYAGDIGTVAGQPNLLVVAQNVSGFHRGVAVFENGVARPERTPSLTTEVYVEPSTDSGVFFAYDRDPVSPRFRRLRLDASGMTEIETARGMEGYPSDFRSQDDLAFFRNGLVWDGVRMELRGVFPADGPVCPDLSANRVLFVARNGGGYSIDAYDPASFSIIRSYVLPASFHSPGNVIRWGRTGLALQNGSSIGLIDSNQLVPTGAPADLALSARSGPNPAFVNEPLVYTLVVTNLSPTSARGTYLTATLSSDQSVESAIANPGTSVIDANTVTWRAGDLEAGKTATLTIRALPKSAGSLSLSAMVLSESNDPAYDNNRASNYVMVGFRSSLDTVHLVRVTANNLLFDPGRNRLWLSTRPTGTTPGSLVALDPNTGLTEEPIPFVGDPRAGCMVISDNGHYLYLGVNDSQELLRFDLASTPAILRIPLVFENGPFPNYAYDVEPLEGDGTSFLVSTVSNGRAAVFDGTVARTNRTAAYTARQIDRTAIPGMYSSFVPDQGYAVNLLQITPTGVSILESVPALAPYASQAKGSGNLLLSNGGQLIDLANLWLLANFGASGIPCLDLPNRRAYLLTPDWIRGFDTVTTQPTASFNYSDSPWAPWPQVCVRWGLDGFAMLGDDGHVRILRWSETIPTNTDANTNGISDGWEAAYFNTLEVNPAADADGDGLSNFEEYLFGTSPVASNGNPIQLSTTNVTGEFALRLVFPRRAGLTPQPYDYSISPDLRQWSSAQNASETILSSQTVDGVLVETVEAIIPFPGNSTGFLRFEWKPH